MTKECVLRGVLSVSVDVCPFFVSADTQPQCSLSRTAAYRVEVRDYKPVRMHLGCWYPSRQIQSLSLFTSEFKACLPPLQWDLQ